MLNVNRILIFVLIGIFSSLLHAVDISNFDIKGIKLGSSQSFIKTKLHNWCNNIDFKNQYIGNKLWISYITCGKKSNRMETGIEYRIVTNQNKLAFIIQREKIFTLKPNLKKIEKQLFEKYGKPQKITKSTLVHNSNAKGYIKYYCWGECSISIEDGEWWKGKTIHTINKGKSLIIKYKNYTKFHNEGEYYSLFFILEDDEAYINNEKWGNTTEKAFIKNKKEQESNLDL